MDKKVIYVRLKRKTTVPNDALIRVSDIAYLSGADQTLIKQLKSVVIYRVTQADQDYAVIDSIQLIDVLYNAFPTIQWELIGFTETVLHIEHKKKNWLSVKFIIAWLILFVGTAMTIINFHYDVSMLEVHQKLHFLFTGEKVQHPLWLQIPYSIGLGIGMILFLNHWFKKQLNEEPSPLELELFTYEQKIEEYLAHYENNMNDDNYSI